MEKKRKGGAEKQREQKKKLLKIDAESCAKLTDLFSAGAQKQQPTSDVAVAGSSSTKHEEEQPAQHEHADTTKALDISESVAPEKADLEFDMPDRIGLSFARPAEYERRAFYQAHPEQPVQGILFSPGKVYKRKSYILHCVPSLQQR